MHIRTAAVLATAVLLAVSACSSQTTVGSDKLKDFKQQTAQPKLGEATTPPATKAPVKAPPKSAAPVRTSAAPVRSSAPRPTRSAPAARLLIDINSDDSTSTQLNPASATVYKGTVVTWVNRDGQPRGVASADGKAFVSPLIAPGKSWSWTSNAVGTFEYSDSTRPYVTGSLTVRARA